MTLTFVNYRRKRGTYKHTYTDSYLIDLKNSQSENPVPSEQSLEENAAAHVKPAEQSLEENTAAHVKTADREVDGKWELVLETNVMRYHFCSIKSDSVTNFVLQIQRQTQTRT